MSVDWREGSFSEKLPSLPLPGLGASIQNKYIIQQRKEKAKKKFL